MAKHHNVNQLTFDFTVGWFEPEEVEVMVEEPELPVAEPEPEEPELPYYVPADYDSIRRMLPKLYDTQCEDIVRIEKRFAVGKGYLCTNGTGTGKTYVGLGTIYRFWWQDRDDIIIVCPTEKKCLDWILEAAKLGLKVTQLEGIHDGGRGIVVTTYANFYANDMLELRDWDLVVYDESHYLGQNADGDMTVYFMRHRKIACLPDAAREKAKPYCGIEPVYPEDWRDDNNGYQRLVKWKEEMEVYNAVFREKAIEFINHTKVLFLSATPFAYHKSIQYVDGCLFDICELLDPEPYSDGYNVATGFSKFLCDNFGYRMRYGKCTIPETGVDLNLMERMFFENSVEKGLMSTRVIDLDFDYSRDFITIDSEIGNFINSGLELFHDRDFRENYKELTAAIGKKYNKNFINQLLECIKAKEVHERVKKHLALGRKVVIFHSFNNSMVEHPFKFNAHDLVNKGEEWKIRKLDQEINRFNEEYSRYRNLKLDDLTNTRESILRYIPNAKQFNGMIGKKKRSNDLDLFNDDNSGVDVMIVQTKAGREGISMHDKTGNKQRVLITLGLPTEPTAAIQTEGRIYREGLKSNAIYEYITLQTNIEQYIFGYTIAERSRTAENLAMGNLARDLETSFKEGYMGSAYIEPNLEQGTGGKAMDRTLQKISDFERAKTFYFARQKRTSRNKSKEGIDYFATPEPFGYKMAQWADGQPNEHGLEPSAGHGANARFFPAHCSNTFIEPSFELSCEIGVNSIGKVLNYTFEEYSYINKADFIIMNPPFGTAGKMAMEHIAKALVRHTRSGGRCFAIMPSGPSMDKRLGEFLTSEDSRDFDIDAEIQLPSCMFERAGTSVMCRMIKFVNVRNQPRIYDATNIDLTHIQTIGEFFDAIEHLTL